MFFWDFVHFFRSIFKAIKKDYDLNFSENIGLHSIVNLILKYCFLITIKIGIF